MLKRELTIPFTSIGKELTIEHADFDCDVALTFRDDSNELK